MYDCIRFLHDIKKVYLWARLAVCNGNSIYAHLNGVIAVFSQKILEQNVGQLDDIRWSVCFFGELKIEFN